jgi:hypothetical protein
VAAEIGGPIPAAAAFSDPYSLEFQLNFDGADRRSDIDNNPAPP